MTYRARVYGCSFVTIKLARVCPRAFRIVLIAEKVKFEWPVQNYSERHEARQVDADGTGKEGTRLTA